MRPLLAASASSANKLSNVRPFARTPTLNAECAWGLLVGCGAQPTATRCTRRRRCGRGWRGWCRAPWCWVRGCCCGSVEHLSTPSTVSDGLRLTGCPTSVPAAGRVGVCVSSRLDTQHTRTGRSHVTGSVREVVFMRRAMQRAGAGAVGGEAEEWIAAPWPTQGVRYRRTERARDHLQCSV